MLDTDQGELGLNPCLVMKFSGEGDTQGKSNLPDRARYEDKRRGAVDQACFLQAHLPFLHNQIDVP